MCESIAGQPLLRIGSNHETTNRTNRRDSLQQKHEHTTRTRAIQSNARTQAQRGNSYPDAVRCSRR